ncbi:MAG: hypothetical protein KAH84_03305 [Thiomargarita sp.]|nr:hypothetical protein [Thiomargarita sp.]
MTISDIKKLFEDKFSKHFDKLSVISEDSTNHIILCNFTNKFFNFDKIAKQYHPSWATTDMIFFDLEREYIVFVEYKNSEIKSNYKPKIKQKFLDSFALLYKILGIEKDNFWHFKTYLLFVTSKEKNKNQVKYKSYMGSEEILNILESDVILYGLERYRAWYFDEIKTPFCDEFPKLMENEFKIQLKAELA